MTRLKNQQNNVEATVTPRLRFAEFRDAPGWLDITMGDVYSFKSNNSLSREKLNYTSGSLRNIHYGDIHTKFSSLFDVSKELVPFINPSEPHESFRPENDCTAGDMVFADASEDMDDIGKAIEIIQLNGERVVAGLHTILARPNLDRIAIGFGGHLFKCLRVRAQIKRESQGAKVLGISATRLSKIALPIPQTKAEQQKIAECLGSLDELIGAESQKLDALKAYKKGLMQQLFPPEGETLPRLRFPEFRDAPEWSASRTSDIAVVHQGYGFPDRYQGRQSGEFPFYKVSDISRALAGGAHLIDAAANYVDREVLSEIKAKLIPPGTTVFAKIGEALRLNRRALTIKPCLVDNNTAGVKAIQGRATDQFLFYLWSTISLDEHAGGVVPAVSKSAIEAIPITYPQIDEQTKIADLLASMDRLLAERSSRLIALRTHKQGLMQQLFPSSAEVEG